MNMITQEAKKASHSKIRTKKKEKAKQVECTV